MLGFKFKIMLISIWTKSDLFYHRFGGIGLDFLLLFTLVVQEFIEFYDPAYRRIGIGRDHDQILPHFFCPLTDHPGRVDTWFYFFTCYFADVIEVVTYQSNIRYADISIDLKLKFRVVLFGGVIVGKSFSQG